MAGWFALLFLLALTIALALFVSARRQRAHTGLPPGARIVYADTGAWKKVERPLFSRRYGLTGKPDYIVAERGATIPIEVKPNRVAPAPRESDTLQLAAYALLVEEHYGTAPAYGLLKYRDAVFQVDITAELRARLLDTLAALRRDLSARDVARSHAEARRCRACGYREVCGRQRMDNEP
jgi:CRISPR-associated exonuclease Cas4